ncbi:MAG: putative glycosylase [Phycisphaerales bacterium]|nr:putative glycosylase [Phycisphaerales bacterium]
MKKLIVFDLDGTLAESKSALDAEMTTLLGELMIVYHGVHAEPSPATGGKQLCYSAGVMILAQTHPRTILYRSKDPVLEPKVPQERDGVVANVVFPTGIDRRDDLGMPDRFDIYYGMADSRIGVATMQVPGQLPLSNAPKADAPGATAAAKPLEVRSSR